MKSATLLPGKALRVLAALLVCMLVFVAPLCLANGQDDAAAARLEKLYKEKQEVDDQISGLAGKPEELEKGRQQIGDAYRHLKKMEMKLQAIQLWNRFAGFMGVANDAITKINPCNSVVSFLAGFFVDRAGGAMNNPPLQAKMGALKSNLSTATPSLHQLDQALHLSPEQTADLLVSRGMVTLEWISLWKRTPEYLVATKSGALVTGKITFIQERLGPAIRDLVSISYEMAGVIAALRSHQDALEKRSRELEREIKRINNNNAFTDALKNASQPRPLLPHVEVTLYPPEPMAYAAAAAKARKAWDDLKSNAIDEGTYRAILNKTHYDANAFIWKTVEPQAKAYQKEADFYWNELFRILRTIDDRATRRAYYNAACQRLNAAYDAYHEAMDAQWKAKKEQYDEPVKKLREEEETEKQLFAAWDKRVTDWEQIPATYYYPDWDKMKLFGNDWKLGGSSFSGFTLAGLAWGAAASLDYYARIGGSPPVSRLQNASKNYAQWAETITHRTRFAEEIYSNCLSADTRFLGYADMVDGLAQELEPNIEVWEYIRPWSNFRHGWPRQMYNSMKGCSEIYSLMAQGMAETAEANIQDIREQARRAQQAASAMAGADAAWALSQSTAEALIKAHTAFGNQNLDPAGSRGPRFLRDNKISKDDIAAINELTESLNTPEKVEEHALVLYANRYGGALPFVTVPTVEQVAAIKKRYDMQATPAANAYNEYSTAYSEYVSAEKSLESTLDGMRNRIADAAPAQLAYLYPEVAVADALGGGYGPFTLAGWYPPDPQDMAAGYPLADGLFAQLTQAVTRYHQKVDPVLNDIQGGFVSRAKELDALTASARAMAASPSGGSAAALENLHEKGEEIYAPLKKAGLIESGMTIHRSYNALNYAISSAYSRMTYIMHRDQTLSEISTQLEQAEQILDSGATAQSLASAESMRQVLAGYLSPRSRLFSYADTPGVAELMQNIRDTVDRLSDYMTRANAAREQEQRRKVGDFYKDFSRTYESRDAGAVVGLLDTGWYAPDGSTLDDVEEMLDNSFSVFDRVEYHVDSLSVINLGDGTMQATYTARIKGYIYDSDLTHEETSSVTDILGDRDGRLRVLRTTGGRFWRQ
ncbi:MAG: hypothetical protein KKA60_00680 [Proteobacteria bacterium]|nr:hypothetical protein [Pseudomonadota bacterium]